MPRAFAHWPAGLGDCAHARFLEIDTCQTPGTSACRFSSALDFYARAFGAQEIFRMPTPDGGVAHAEFMIGNTLLGISDEAPDWHAYALPEGTMASCLFVINTDDCDKAFARAVAAGAKPLIQPQDYFWGKRIGVLCDPFGYRWSIRQHVEDVSPEEMARRVRAMSSKGWR